MLAVSLLLKIPLFLAFLAFFVIWVAFAAWEVLTPLERPFGSQVVWSYARVALN